MARDNKKKRPRNAKNSGSGKHGGHESASVAIPAKKCSLRGWLLSIIAFLSTGLGGIVLSGNALEKLRHGWEYLFPESGEIVAIRSRLEPLPWTTDLPDEQRDQAFLLIELRNNGTQPKILKSARIRVSGGDATIGPGGKFGSCVLSNEPNANPPVVLGPGQTRWVSISPSIRLPGLHAWFSPDRLSRITLLPEAYGIHELAHVDALNATLSQQFGKNSQITVELFDGGDRRLKSLAFPLAHGKDIFAKDGSLMHDTFIAHWIAWQRGTPPAGHTPACLD